MSESLAALSVEPLSDHDRSSFSCGTPELDDYLRQQAGQDAKRRVAAPFVLVDQAHRILGYYTLSAYAVRVSELPPEVAKKLPKYPLIPATLLGRLAVSREHKGQKLGRVLLADALYRSLRNTREVASVGVVAEALNDEGHAFYLYHGFVALREHPRKVFMAMATIKIAFA